MIKAFICFIVCLTVCVCYLGKYIPPHQRGSGHPQTSDSWADSDSYRGGGQGKYMCLLCYCMQIFCCHVLGVLLFSSDSVLFAQFWKSQLVCCYRMIHIAILVSVFNILCIYLSYLCAVSYFCILYQ